MTGVFKAAACVVDVTPDYPINLSGSGAPEKIVSKIDSNLEWQILRLSNGIEEIYLLSGDFLSVGKMVEQVAQDALPDVKSGNILVLASHSHSAPAIDDLLPNLGKTDQKYLVKMFDDLTDALKKLSRDRLQTVQLKYAKGSFAGNIYRRRRTWRPTYPFRATVIMPNENIAVPNDIDFFRIENNKSEPLAVLWSWTCHPNLYPDKDAISSEFPGHVRTSLRQKYCNLPVLFLQGFAGDVNSTNYAAGDSLKGKLKRLFYGNTFGRTRFQDWNKWADALAVAVNDTDEQARREDALEPVKFGSLKQNIPLEKLQDVSVEGRNLTIQKFSIAKNHMIVALGCEPVHEWRSILAKYVGKNNLIAVGYAGHIFGYLPTNAQLKENGYEDHGFRSNFSLPGRYHKNLEQRLETIIGKIQF